MPHILTQHHIEVSVENDGTILIEQVDHSGNREVVCLHTSQLRAVAEHVGLLEPLPSLGLPASLKGRLKRIRERSASHHASVVNQPGFPHHPDEFDEASDALRLVDELDDLLDDFFEIEGASGNKTPEVSSKVSSPVNTCKPSPPAHDDNDGQLF
jgi:hypothetical protein